MFSNSHSYIKCLNICNHTSLITEKSAIMIQKFNYFMYAVPISNLNKNEFSTSLRFINQLFYLGNILFNNRQYFESNLFKLL